MLQPEYLDGIAEPIQALYSEMETRIMADIARRIAGADYVMTPTAEWQIYKLQQMGLAQEYLNQELARTLKISEKTLNEIFKNAGIKSMKTDVETQKAAISEGKLPEGTIPLSASASFSQVINANAIRTHQTMKKLTGTIAIDVNGKINKYMDMCQLMVQSGAFTQQAAIDIAVRRFSAEGIGYFEYVKKDNKTEKIYTSIEAAVRRACITGVNQATAEVSLNNVQELDTDLVEVTSHAGARPDHAEWQGKIYSISGNSKKYRKFTEATGYGTGAGLCGWNCRHSFYAYIEGVSERVKPEKYDEKRYENEQIQRKNERTIRYWKKRAATLQAAGINNSKEVAKIREWQAKQRDHLTSSGLRRDYNREQIRGASALSDMQKERGLYKQNVKPKYPKVVKAPDAVLQKTMPVDSPEISLSGIIPQGVEMKVVRIIAGHESSVNIKAASKLAELYGGNDWMWQKKSGIIKTDNFIYEVHWYEYSGAQYENKLKGVKRIAKN